MFKSTSLLILAIGLCAFSAFGQDCFPNRYINDLFNVSVTQEPAIFATVPDLDSPFLNENNTTDQDLSYDFYEPVGDTLSQRPLIIVSFGGSFLLGDKRQSELVEYCEAMTRKGFCVASIDYRIGFNFLSTNSAVRAVYRGAQDFRAAVRYFREHAATYRIDPDHVFGGGNSAGSINAIHAAYLVESDRAASTLLAATYNNPDLGEIDSSGNDIDQPGAPNAIVNFWGGIGDTSWINAGDAPISSYHGLADNVINPNTGSPFDFSIFPELHGSIPMRQRANNIGVPNLLDTFPGLGHEFWDDPVMAQLLVDSASVFLHRYMRPKAPMVIGELKVCEGTRDTFGVPGTPISSSLCWSVTGGTIVDSARQYIAVEWGSSSSGTVQVLQKNYLDAVSETTTIDIIINPAPLANFTHQPDGPNTLFTDLSIDADSHSWDFGDGNTSMLADPTHTYVTNGIYTVTLTIENPGGCVDTFTTTVKQLCQPTLTVTVDPTPTGTYQAHEWVESSKILAGGSNVTFRAGTYVELQAGFEVNLGDEFLAQIEGCP